ncbi:DUF3302 domain-containing protein [Roseovarius sp. M141]|uniref:DUF3302 domain-containing protein n=1 Tax=Roseovarius sp. M141 TaxID=2583806 RepID=UPI0020CD2B17|nr:DUF3302 domain-containing protein [Roseovarius sp. M141]
MEQAESGFAAFRNSYYFWDWITLGCGFLTMIGGLYVVTRILGLPGRIAVARKHPDAEAVYTMGWVGFLAVVPWIQAFIWAFKPTDKVDIRRFPKEEQEAEKEDLARLMAYAYGTTPDGEPPQKDAPTRETPPKPESDSTDKA